VSNSPRFHLFACNIPVAGASKAIICDLQRSAHFEITLGLYSMITKGQGRTVAELKSEYPKEDADHIDEALGMLVDAELGFFDDSDGEFPPLDLTHRTPEHISNAIIDANATSAHDYTALFDQLDELGCSHVELRFYDPVDARAIDALLSRTKRSRLRSIEITLPYAGWDDEAFDALCETHARIATLNVFGAPRTEMVTRQSKWEVRFFQEKITSANDCGKIHPAYFGVNQATFSEAQTFNSCLNKKVGIDIDGNIKNCPSHGKCHGKVGSERLVNIVTKDSFRKPWHTARDQVAVCKDCEYRYICTDCRVFVADPNDPLSKPAKCGYDPYTGQWQ